MNKSREEINPLYKIYRNFNKKERTPDEHALVSADFKIIRDNFFGYFSLKIFGDKNYNNWINKLAYNLDVFFLKYRFCMCFMQELSYLVLKNK